MFKIVHQTIIECIYTSTMIYLKTTSKKVIKFNHFFLDKSPNVDKTIDPKA